MIEARSKRALCSGQTIDKMRACENMPAWYKNKALAKTCKGFVDIVTDGLSTEVIVHDRRFFYTEVGKHGNYGL